MLEVQKRSLHTPIEEVFAHLHSIWKASFCFQDLNNPLDALQRASMLPTEAFHTSIPGLHEALKAHRSPSEIRRKLTSTDQNLPILPAPRSWT